MSEKERVREMRKRNLKRAFFAAAFVLFFVMRSLRRRRKRAGESEKRVDINDMT